MSDDNTGPRPIVAATLSELLSYEEEISRRINTTPNGARLLMADPQRLLHEVRVEVAPDALHEWQTKFPEFFESTGHEHVYDILCASRPGDEITITVNGLFRKIRP